MKNIKKFIIFLIVVFLFPALSIADYSELFISTEPVGASVTLDYLPVGETPLRIVIKNSKKYLIKIMAEGYHPLEVEKTLGEKRREVLFFALEPEKINIIIESGERDILVNGVPSGKTPVAIMGIPSGTYRIESDEKGVSLWINNGLESRRESLIDLFFSSSLFGLSVTGFLLNHDSNFEKEVFFKTSALTFGILSGYNFMKFLKSGFEYKTQFDEFYKVSVSPYKVSEAKTNFLKGMELLGNGKYKDAIPYFNIISELYPESEYLPTSIYETGYCYYMLDDSKGIEYLKRYIKDYPQPDLFQMAVKMLLELQLKNNFVYDALTTYQSSRPILINDPDGEILISYYRILTDLFKKTGKIYNIILEDILREVDYFLTTYKDVPKYPDILMLKGKLYYRYFNKESGEKIFMEILKKYPHRSDLKKEIRNISEYGKSSLL